MDSYEVITAPDGKVWRMKRGQDQSGKPHTGRCAWFACTGGAGRSDQWRFGSTRDEVLARINCRASAS